MTVDTAVLAPRVGDSAFVPDRNEVGRIVAFPSEGAATVVVGAGGLEVVALSEVTLLPRGGALVSLPDGSVGVWLGARTEGGRLTADLLVGEAVTERTLDPSEADAGRLVVESESDDVHGLSAALVAMVSAERAAREAAASAELTLREKETAWQRWKDRLVEAAHERADGHDYCSEFDDFMEDHGLPPRMHDFDVEVTLRVTVVKSARTADDATDGVEASDVEDAVGELSWVEYDFTVGSAERR